MRLGEFLQPVGAAPDQDRIGHHPVAVLQRHAALVADRTDRADQVLVHAHTSGDAVHDDAETLLGHVLFLLVRKSWFVTIQPLSVASSALGRKRPAWDTAAPGEEIHA